MRRWGWLLFLSLVSACGEAGDAPVVAAAGDARAEATPGTEPPGVADTSTEAGDARSEATSGAEPPGLADTSTEAGDAVVDAGLFWGPETEAEDLMASDEVNWADLAASDEGAFDHSDPPPDRMAKSLVIAVDGLRADALAFAETPHIDSLIGGTWHPDYQGAYTSVAQNLYDAVTLSGPNHVAIMTGATGAQHGVTSNADLASGHFQDFPHYLAMLEAHDASLNTAYLVTWGPDLEIPSGADYVRDSEDEENTARAVALLEGGFEEAGDRGSRWTLGADLDALFIFLDDVDHVGHASGFELSVAQYVAAIEQADEQVGRLLDALTARPGFAQESWQIVLTTDHGGYHWNHGGWSAPEHTIPFLVAGREVVQGRLAEATRVVDVVPTVLAHMSVPVPPALTGSVRGHEVSPVNAASFAESLIAYYPFDGDFTDQSGNEQHASVGLGAEIDPGLVTGGGKFGGFVAIDAPNQEPCYVSLGQAPVFDFGDNEAFTVTLWFRAHGDQAGDPVIVGNKDWVSGSNPGWVILADEGGDNSFGFNAAGTDGARLDLEDIDYSDTNWWFLAVVFRPDGLATMVAGDSAGGLRWMALEAQIIGELSAPHPLNLGQDGTGSYPYNLDGDVDDLAIWRRALAPEEIRQLYAEGVGVALGSLL